jgi:SAM-dependent methyltransferase
LGEFVREVEAHPERNYLDIGCGLRNQVYENCLYLEVYPSITADIVMEPACRYPIASGSLDGVCCLAVLEHVEQPWIVAEEIRRMLKPGGLAFIDWPFLQPVHGYPSHFYNATRSGLSALFQDGFEQIVLDTLSNQTPDHTLNWILREWSAALTSEPTRAELLGMTVADLMREAPGSPFWRRVLAATPDKAKMTFACGNTLIARKSGDTPREAVTDRRPAHTPRPLAADAGWWNLFRRRNIKAKD